MRVSHRHNHAALATVLGPLLHAEDGSGRERAGNAGRKVLLLALFAACLIGCDTGEKPSDYLRELAQINSAIVATKNGFPAASARREQMARLVYLCYIRASLTGDYGHYRATEATLNQAIGEFGATSELLYYRALLNFKLHRLRQAQDDLNQMAELKELANTRALRVDIALQQGRYLDAEAGYKNMAKIEPSWDQLARLAYYKANTGNASDADSLYAVAQSGLTAKEMRTYAWLELQRGVLDLDSGKYDAALAHYNHANRAYSGYWLIEEHIAEILYLLGRGPESVGLYEELVNQTGNPEFISALATALARQDPVRSGQLYEQADALFEQRLQLYPEAAVGHLIEHLLGRADQGGSEKLIAFARKNHELRPNSAAKLLLARAYLKADRSVEAARLLKQVMQTPWRPARLTRILAEVERRTAGLRKS